MILWSPKSSLPECKHPGLDSPTLLVFWKESLMLYYALVFFVIALVAALFGFGGIAAGAAGIAKILFIVFLILFVVSLIFGMRGRGKGAL